MTIKKQLLYKNLIKDISKNLKKYLYESDDTLMSDIFNDNEIFNNNDEYDVISHDLFNYNIGDIYYKDTKPYAICCGLNTDFQDDNFRFLLLEKDYNVFSHILTSKYIISKFKDIDYKTTNFTLRTKNDFIPIDENGYENLQFIRTHYDIKKFPAFEYCYKLGNNIYLPAIDELQILYLNLNTLTDNCPILKTAINFLDISKFILSSTFANSFRKYINTFWGICEGFGDFYKLDQVQFLDAHKLGFVLPFVNI